MTNPTTKRLPLLVVALITGCSTTPSTTTMSWPQWGGPQRDFKTPSVRLASQWPDAGPRQVWKRALGDGYSAIAADNGRLYTMFREGDEEVVAALDAKSGDSIWQHRYSAAVYEGMETRFGIGPRATPLIAEGRIYTLGMAGMLVCLDARDGKVVWSHDLLAEYAPKLPKFGVSASPLRHGDSIVVAVGGPSAGLMAFNLSDGALRWRNQDFEDTYSSPIVITVDGRDQIVLLANTQIVGLNPTDGTLLWSRPHENQWKTNICTPVWDGRDMLFVSSSGDVGSRVLKLSRKGDTTEVTEVWSGTQMKVGQGIAVLVGETVYGVSGDENASFLAAVNLKSGELAWRERGFAKSTLLYAGGKLIILGEDGMLTLAVADPKKVEVLSKCKLFEGTAWTAPTLIGTTMYVRDRESIIALDVG